PVAESGDLRGGQPADAAPCCQGNEGRGLDDPRSSEEPPGSGGPVTRCDLESKPLRVAPHARKRRRYFSVAWLSTLCAPIWTRCGSRSSGLICLIRPKSLHSRSIQGFQDPSRVLEQGAPGHRRRLL